MEDRDFVTLADVLTYEMTANQPPVARRHRRDARRDRGVIARSTRNPNVQRET